MNSAKTSRSLRRRIIGASSWVISGHLVAQLLRLGGNLIMTRLLVPEMFAVMAVAGIFLLGLNLFSDVGLRQNIIQSEHGTDPVFLNTAWIVQILRGVILWLIGLGLATAFQTMNTAQMWTESSVYAEPVLPYVLIAISFNALIIGFESTKMALANRDLKLKFLVRNQILPQVAGLIVMISWALIDRSVWALVAGSLVVNILKVILSHIWVPGPNNKLQWDKSHFINIFSFGKWIFLNSILGFLIISGDRILLGGLVEAKILGLYVIAFFLADATRQIILKIIASVLFPALSEIVRGKVKDLQAVYYRIRLPIDIVSLTGAGFLFASGSTIIEILYDDRYLPAGHMLEMLSIALIAVRYRLVGPMFVSMGKPHLLILIFLPQLLALYILLPIAFKLFGLDGAVWIAGGIGFFSLPVIFYLKIRYSVFNIIKEIRVLPILGVGYALGLLVTFAHTYLLTV
jgi:O-antigen/teichoic acid export membrane protein